MVLKSYPNDTLCNCLIILQPDRLLRMHCIDRPRVPEAMFYAYFIVYMISQYSQNHLTKCTWSGVRVSDHGSLGKMGSEKLLQLTKISFHRSIVVRRPRSYSNFLFWWDALQYYSRITPQKRGKSCSLSYGVILEQYCKEIDLPLLPKSFHHIKVIFKRKLLVEYNSKSSSYE